MKTSANRIPFVLSILFGLGWLGMLAWLCPNASMSQSAKNQLVGYDLADAQEKRPSNQTTPSLVPDQTITELSVDDGIPESALGASGGGTITGVNRLTPPSYPSTLTNVTLYFQSQMGLTPGAPITILVGTNPSGGANISNVTFTQINTVAETGGSFFPYSVAPVTINSGDFVVGWRVTHASGVFPLPIDRTLPRNQRSYVSTGGALSLLDEAAPSFAGNFLIRARVQGQPPGCPSVSSINPPGGAVGSQVIITGNNFTGVTAVRFTGGVSAQFTVNSNTQITATVPQGAATGPLTISKTNCPDAQTSAFAVNTSSATELAVDDGTFETTLGLGGGGTSWRVNRLTPSSYPATINGVSIFFRSNSNLTVGAPLTILFGPNPSGGAGINGIQLQTMESTVQALGQFNVYSVPPFTINSGDVVVGYKITHDSTVFPFALDTTPPSQRRSYRSLDGVTYNIIDDLSQTQAGNYGIRARLQTATQNCPTVTNINPISGTVGSQVTINGSGFTGVNAVRFTNNVNASFTVNSDTQIIATVPAGAVTGPLTISKPNCPNVTTANFTVGSACTYSINPTTQNFAASGGTGSVAVTTQAGCAWTATSNAAFITINSGASGSGNGSVGYSVAANTGAARNGTLIIAGQTFTVTQAGGSCTYSINPTSRSHGVEGGTGTVAVNTQTGCAWTATSNANWLTITAGSSGNGAGTVSYSVASNFGGAARSGTLTIAGQTFTVDQPGCTFTLSTTSQTFASSGGSGSVNVTAASGCTWTAASNAAFITLTSGASGNGNGTVNFSVATNTGAPRLGTLTIAGRTFTVAQGSDQPTPYRGLWQGMTDQSLPLRFTVDNNDIVVNLETDMRVSFFVPPNGQATCTYRMRGDAPALINNGQFEVKLTSADNAIAFQTGAEPLVRGTLSSTTSATGQITSSTAGFIICSGNLSFGSISVGSRTWDAQKQVQPGCQTITNISPTSGATGNQVTITGSGFTGVNAVKFANNVNATFTVNSDSQITATVPNGAVTGPITISKPNCPDVTSANFTVNRACNYAIAPTSQFFLSSGGTGSVNVTAEAGCAWTATSNAPWVTITAGASGSGNGKVDYTVAADTSGGVRSGTLTIAGQTFSVQQGFVAGSGWAQQNSGVTQELRSVHSTSENDIWAAGANATVLHSIDGGKTWTPVNTGVDPAKGFNSVRFLNQSVGWAGGNAAVARTLDGGANWASASLSTSFLSTNNISYNAFFPVSSTEIWSAGSGTSSTGSRGPVALYVLNTSGALSMDFSSSFGGSAPDQQILDLYFLAVNNGWLIGPAGITRFAPVGTSQINIQFQSRPTSESLNGIYMLNDNAGWIVGNKGIILKTINGGSQWTLQNSGTTANLRDVHFVDPNRGWAVGDGGTILTSSDGGVSWAPEPSGVSTDLRSVFFFNASSGFVVGANGLILKRTTAPSAFASVSAASYGGGGLAAEVIAAGFGQGLAPSIEVATSVPLPTTLAGTSVVVRDSASFNAVADSPTVDRLAPLFFVSPGQINFQIPPGTAPGAATINVLRGGAVVASGVVQIAAAAPGLFTANASGQGVPAAYIFRRRANGSESTEPVAQFDQAQNRFVPAPIDLGPEGDQVVLILFGTGIRGRSDLSAVTCRIGGVEVPVLYAGEQGQFVGLDQINVGILPRNLAGRGEVDLVLTVDGKAANTVRINIK